MGQAETGKTFPALLTDIAVDVGDLKGFFKAVGGVVAFYHDVGRNLAHGRQSTQTAAIAAVAPGTVVFPRRIGFQRKDLQLNTQKHQHIRQGRQQLFKVCQILAVVIEGKDQGQGKDQNQSNAHTLLPTGGQMGIEYRQKDQNSPEKPYVEGIGKAAAGPEAAVDGHHPDGDGCLIEGFFTADKGNEHIQPGGCHRQNDLSPDIHRSIGSFHTEDQNPNHCRGDQAKCHQPGQHIFAADIEMLSFFHSILSITNYALLRK